MLAPLPTGGYQWADPETWDDALGQKIKARHCFHDILDEINASPINFYLEVDAEFPPEIHEKMSDYPMLPEHDSSRIYKPGRQADQSPPSKTKICLGI